MILFINLRLVYSNLKFKKITLKIKSMYHLGYYQYQFLIKKTSINN